MCTRPLDIRVKSRTFGTTRWISAPCGKCNECLKARQSAWKLRICEEGKNWVYFYFFTLTYRNDALPYNVNEETGELLSTARKSHVQSWLKRMREDICRKHGFVTKEERNFFKYFICAEYGPKPTGTKRPHYHGIFMSNLDYEVFAPYFSEWRDLYGRIEFKKVRVLRRYKGDTLEAAKSRASNYVSKYCAKGEFNSRKDDIEKGLIERAWFISSKNIGSSYVEKTRSSFYALVPDVIGVEGDWQEEEVYRLYKSCRDASVFQQVERLVDNCKVYNGLDGYGYKMPRYYRERLFMKRKTYIDKILTCNGIKEKKTTRYVAENFLSVAMSVVVRVRSEEADYRALLGKLGERGCKYPVYDKIMRLVLEVEADKEVARQIREKAATSKLSRFYSTNMFKHKEFDE